MLFKSKVCNKCGKEFDICSEKCPSCKTRDDNFSSYHIPENIFWLHPLVEIFIFLVGFSYGGFLFFDLLYNTIFVTSFPSLDSNLTDFLLNTFVYVSLLVVMLLLILPRFKDFFKEFANPKKVIKGLLFGIAVFLAGYFVEWVLHNFRQSSNENQTGIEILVNIYPIFSFLIFSFIGPIVEEITYRVGLYSFLRRGNKIVAYIVTTVVFAMIHFSFSSGNIVNELLNLPDYLVAGFLFCLAYEKGGISTSIIAHTFNNIVAMIFILI